MNGSAVALAGKRARRLYRGRNLQNTYVRGAQAKLAGKPADSCPYRRDPAKTWRNVYRVAWLRGWESVAGPGTEPEEEL